MKKQITYLLLIISVIINLKYIYAIYKANKIHTTIKEQEKKNPYPKITHFINRHEVFKNLKVDSLSIVLLGDSHFHNLDITDFFKNCHILNRGINGDKSSQILERINQVYGCKTLFIEAGANDIIQKKNLDSAFLNIKQMIVSVHINSPQTRIVILEVFPFRKISLSDSAILLNSKIHKLGVEIIPTFQELSDHKKLKFDCGDGIHLNYEGYRKLAGLIESKL
jgi:hypothetical protein